MSFSTQPKTLLPGLNSCRATGPARRRQRARLVADIVMLAVLVDLLHVVVLMKSWSPRRPSRRLEQDRGKQSPPSQSNFTLNRSSHCVVVQLNSSFSLSRPSSVGQHHCDLQNTLLAFFTGKYGENCHNISSYSCPSRKSDQNAFKVDCCSPKCEWAATAACFDRKMLLISTPSVPTMPIWVGCKMCLRSQIYGGGDSSLHASAQMHSAKSTQYIVLDPIGFTYDTVSDSVHNAVSTC